MNQNFNSKFKNNNNSNNNNNKFKNNNNNKFKNNNNNKFNQRNSNQGSNNLSNNNKKKRNRKRYRNAQRQQDGNQNFFQDDFDLGVQGFNDFRIKKNGELTFDHLMKSIKERKEISLDLLDKLVVEKLNNEEESDVVKIIVRKLLDILKNYQLSTLTAEEKLSIMNRGHLTPN